ncbi:MAG: hypothetical protein C1941_09080 [Prosthecochloris sp.]|nr:hypothetical protein [Prosthecochloris sp.]
MFYSFLFYLIFVLVFVVLLFCFCLCLFFFVGLFCLSIFFVVLGFVCDVFRFFLVMIGFFWFVFWGLSGVTVLRWYVFSLGSTDCDCVVSGYAVDVLRVHKSCVSVDVSG